MNEKIKEVENVLMELMNVSLSKQCKKEYVVYTFYTNTKRENIIRQVKEHFADRELNNSGKMRRKQVEIPIKQFIDDVVYDLLNRGYTLETYD